MGAASTELDKPEKFRAFHTPFLFTATVTAREESLPVDRKYTCRTRGLFVEWKNKVRNQHLDLGKNVG